MPLLNAVSAFLISVMPVWDAASFIVGPLFIFFTLQIFTFRYPRRRKLPILIGAVLLDSVAIVVAEQLMSSALPRFVPLGYLRLSLLSFVIITAGALLLYRGNKLLISLAVLLLYNFFSAIRFMFVGIFDLLLPAADTHLCIAMAIIPTSIILTIIAAIVLRIQRVAVSGLTQRESALWFIVAFLSMILMCFQSDYMLTWWQTILNALNLIMTTSAIYALIFLYSRQKFITTEQQKILSNMEKYEGYLEQMKELDAHISTMRHEVKNHIFYIDQLLAQQDYAALHTYVDKLKSDDLSSVKVISTGHTIVDSIVNAKLSYAHTLGIGVQADVRLPELVRVDDLSLCSLLGNMLSNAIEGSENVPDAAITLDIHPYKDYLVIGVRNAVASNVIKENPHLHTTKGDADNHGIGLKVVEQVAARYEGDLRLEMADKHTFCASVMLKNRPLSAAGHD